MTRGAPCNSVLRPHSFSWVPEYDTYIKRSPLYIIFLIFNTFMSSCSSPYLQIRFSLQMRLFVCCMTTFITNRKKGTVTVIWLLPTFFLCRCPQGLPTRLLTHNASFIFLELAQHVSRQSALCCVWVYFASYVSIIAAQKAGSSCRKTRTNKSKSRPSEVLYFVSAFLESLLCFVVSDILFQKCRVV